jgi:chloramphenicol O-acetyltransferase type A
MQASIKTEINLQNYARKGMFDVFANKQIPVFSTTFTLDITHFKKSIANQKLKFFITISHVLSCVVNNIPAFKHRIIEGKLFEFDVIHPGYTVLLQDQQTFSFCASTFNVDFNTYYQGALLDIEKVLTTIDVSNNDKNHLFFITAIPWFSFTSFSHPYDPENGAIPIITLGKYYAENGQLKLPLSIQVHHGVIDGVHVGQFYEQLQTLLNQF